MAFAGMECVEDELEDRVWTGERILAAEFAFEMISTPPEMFSISSRAEGSPEDEEKVLS